MPAVWKTCSHTVNLDLCDPKSNDSFSKIFLIIFKSKMHEPLSSNRRKVHPFEIRKKHHI